MNQHDRDQAKEAALRFVRYDDFGRLKGLSNDDALALGIRLQNEKYEKLLKFVINVADNDTHTYPTCHCCDAIILLREIGDR